MQDNLSKINLNVKSKLKNDNESNKPYISNQNR